VSKATSAASRATSASSETGVAAEMASGSCSVVAAPSKTSAVMYSCSAVAAAAPIETMAAMVIVLACFFANELEKCRNEDLQINEVAQISHSITGTQTAREAEQNLLCVNIR
jgi:hypothetical protein